MNWVNEVHYGDCRDTMRAMIEDGLKVQMCVTSPPYWGLRDYGTATWEGGYESCNHLASASGPTQNKSNNNKLGAPFRHMCLKCGATRIDKQLGLESTPAEYVANMVDVFGLVRELLADDGVLFLNLGDSYCGSGINDGTKNPGISQAAKRDNPTDRPSNKKWHDSTIKPKDLVGIPWMVAFALRDADWWLRSDIIWHKPSCMPESCKDRPTKSHEYLFLLAKSRQYFYDANAIADKLTETSINRLEGVKKHKETFDPSRHKHTVGVQSPMKVLIGASINCLKTGTANKRSVWTVATNNYSGSHFATFPPKLIEPCILAGSRLGDIVFDPFMGSGTTGMVAERLGRRWIGCELNEKYKPLIDERTSQLGLGI